MKKPVVLIIESDEAVANKLAGFLDSMKFHVVVANEGREGIRRSYELSPSLVLGDYQLSDLTGMEVCSKLKVLFPEKKMPFILMATPSQERLAMRKRKKEERPDDVLKKPFDMMELYNTINTWLESGGPEQAQEKKDAPPSTPPKKAKKKAPKRSAGGHAFPFELSGALDQVPFARLLHHLHKSGMTGALELRREDREVNLFFRKGKPSALTSNYIPEVSLGALLLEEGRIDEQSLSESRKLVEQSGLRQGEALVRIGALDQIALQVQLQKQFRQKLIRIFGEEWKSGEYAFSKGVSQPDPATEMDLDIGSIIMEGIRCNYSLDRLRSYMEKKDRMNLPLARAERYPYNINRLSLTDQEHGLLKQLDGSRNMRELATASDQKEDQIIRAAYAFLVLGMASFADAEGKTAARPKKKKAKKPLPKPKAAAAAPAAKAAEPKAAGPKMDMPLLDKKPVGFSQKESESLKKISELIRNKEYDDAETEIEEFLKSVKSGVVRSEALTTLAQLFYHRATSYGIKRFFRAKELLLEAVAEKPPCEQAFVYLGRIFREQKNYYEALRHLERGKELYPQSFEMQQEIKLVRMYVELR